MFNTVNAGIVGLASGAVFAIVALGLSLTFRSTGVLNVAQGDISVLAAYVGNALIRQGHLPYGVAMAMVAFGAGALMLLLDLFVFRHLQGGELIYVIVLTTGLSFVIESVILKVWGGEALVYAPFLGSRVFSIGKLQIFSDDLYAILVSLALAVLLGAALKLLPIGRKLRASASQPEAAELLGVPVANLRTLALATSGVLAGIAGMLLAPLTSLYPSTGLGITLGAFVGAVIGGFGSMPGAVLGCLIVGLTSGVSSVYVSSSFNTVTAYGLLVLILIFRPSGVFGEEGLGVREI